MDVHLSALLQCRPNISSLEDLLSHPEIKLGLAEDDPLLKDMNISSNVAIRRASVRFMANENCMRTKNYQEGIQQVYNDNNFAFLLDSATAQKAITNNTDCLLQKIGVSDVKKHYAFLVQPAWSKYDQFNEVLESLQNKSGSDRSWTENRSLRWWGHDHCYEKYGSKRCSTHPVQSSSSIILGFPWLLGFSFMSVFWNYWF